LWIRIRATAAASTKADARALVNAAKATTTTSLAVKTGPRRGMKVSQLAIEPLEYSAPMELPATRYVTSPAR
jgi:hypothetical protein